MPKQRAVAVAAFVLGVFISWPLRRDVAVRAETMPPCVAPETEAPVEPVPETPAAQEPVPEAPAPVVPADLRFSEVFPDPAGTDTESEFIELKNIGGAVDVSGWVLETGAAKTYALSGVIAADALLSLPYAQSKISLLNTGMTLLLKRPDGSTADTLTYGTPKTEQSYALVSGAWVWTTPATPGTANAAVVATAPEPEPTPTPTPAPAPTPTPTPEPAPAPASVPVVVSFEHLSITELLPNPAGTDDFEWAELHNAGATEIPLDGLYLDDAEGGSSPYALTGKSVPAGGWLVVNKVDSKISFNNDMDSVRLVTGAGIVQAQVSYMNPPDGKSFALVGDTWTWAATPTPGAENAAPAPATPTDTPIVEVTGTTQAESPGDGGADGTPDGSGGSMESLSEPTALVDVADVAEAAEDELLTVEAVVTVPPGVVGTRTFAVQGANGDGAFVRAFGSDAMPKLQAGDVVHVIGRTKGQTRGAAMLASVGKQVKKIAESLPQYDERAIGDLSEGEAGTAVRVVGKVEKSASKSLTLKDADGATIKVISPVRVRKLSGNADVRVSGVVAVGKDGLELLTVRDGDIEPVASAGAGASATDAGVSLADGKSASAGAASAVGSAAGASGAVREPKSIGGTSPKKARNTVLGAIMATGATGGAWLLWKRRQAPEVDILTDNR